MTALLPNARQQVWMSGVFGDGYNKGSARVTVFVPRLRSHCSIAMTICQNLQCSIVMSIYENVQPFTGNGDVCKAVKHSGVGRKTQYKQTKCCERKTFTVTCQTWRYIFWFYSLFFPFLLEFWQLNYQTLVLQVNVKRSASSKDKWRTTYLHTVMFSTF